MATEADTESGIEQEEHYQGLADTPDVTVEFGGMGAVAVGSWKSFWSKLTGLFKHAAKGAASSVAVKDAINAQYPGLGDAAQKGMQLVEAGNAGNPTALAQIKAISDAAKAGDEAKAGAAEMLKAIADGRKAATTETAVAVGKDYARIRIDGKIRTFKTKAQYDAYMKQRAAKKRPATPSDVQRAIARTPAPARPRLVQQIQQAQAQGQYPVTPLAPYGYGAPQPYGYGSPYAQGVWGGQPVTQPYGPQWYSPAQYEQAAYYGEDDYELAQATAGDESFPDEGLAGENPITYQG